MPEVIAMMVGRELNVDAPAGRRAHRPRGRARGRRAAAPRTCCDDVELRAAQGRDPRLRRADGRRPDRGRARDRRRGPDRRRHDQAARARDQGRPTRPTPRGTGSATCPRTASGSACCSSRRSARNIGLSALAERFQAWGFVKDAAMRATAADYVGPAADQDAVGQADDQEPLRRQPAEGGDRQVAREGLRHPDLRRADARHRRGRQGGDLPAAERPGGRAASRSS